MELGRTGWPSLKSTLILTCCFVWHSSADLRLTELEVNKYHARTQLVANSWRVSTTILLSLPLLGHCKGHGQPKGFFLLPEDAGSR